MQIETIKEELRESYGYSDKQISHLIKKYKGTKRRELVDLLLYKSSKNRSGYRWSMSEDM